VLELESISLSPRLVDIVLVAGEEVEEVGHPPNLRLGADDRRARITGIQLTPAKRRPSSSNERVLRKGVSKGAQATSENGIDADAAQTPEQPDTASAQARH